MVNISLSVVLGFNVKREKLKRQKLRRPKKKKRELHLNPKKKRKEDKTQDMTGYELL